MAAARRLRVAAFTPRSASATRKAVTVAGEAGIAPARPCARHHRSKIRASERYALTVARALLARWYARTTSGTGSWTAVEAARDGETGRETIGILSVAKLPRRTVIGSYTAGSLRKAARTRTSRRAWPKGRY